MRAVLVILALSGCASSTAAPEPAPTSSGSESGPSARAISPTEFEVTRAWAEAMHDGSAAFHLERDEQAGGMRVYGVRAESDAAALGFQNGDVIISVNGVASTEAPALDGHTLVIVIRRAGAEQTHTIHVVDHLD